MKCVRIRTNLCPVSPYLEQQPPTSFGTPRRSGHRAVIQGREAGESERYKWYEPDHGYLGVDPAAEERRPLLCNCIAPHDPAEYDDMWQPVADFIQSLPRLTDLAWESSQRFPSCILDVLNHKKPTPRLHMDDFRLRCFIDGPGQSYCVHPADYALVTSPCMYNARITYVHQRAEACLNPATADLILHMLCHNASNLRHLRTHYQRSTDTVYQDAPPPQVPGLSPWPNRDGPGAALTSLVITQHRDHQQEDLMTWRLPVNTNMLTVLDIDVFPTPNLLSRLLDLAKWGALNSLHSFSFGMVGGLGEELSLDWSEQIDESSGKLLQHLPRLHHLRLSRCTAVIRD